tara:strand:- start:3298 stop:3909 length:612 start_codon:yes stop_codon:yes gene_type:complete
MEKQKKRNLFQYGIFAVLAITLYITGLHTEVIGFAQRGLLATGLMNPNVEEITQMRNNKNETTTLQDFKQADFNLKLIDENGTLKSFADFKGKVIFMNLWATWCPPCVAEMPNIAKLHKEMGDEVAFVMLSFDQDFDNAKDFKKRKGYDLPIYAPASNLPKMFQSSALPTTYIIDTGGNLVLVHRGMADYSDQEFKHFLNSLK